MPAQLTRVQSFAAPALLLLLGAGCGAPAPSWDVPQDASNIVASVTGLSGPEAVRYDPEQDVYFIANFNGDAAGDANGFITRAGADGTVDSLRFMVGTDAAPLHGPRGMLLVGDTLFAADADGVHAFDRRTGAHRRFIDLRPLEPGFLNDLTQGADGAIYLTDTGRSRVYRLGESIEIAIEDSALANPNGITWDAQGSRFLLATWDPASTVLAWDGASAVSAVGPKGSGRNDGIELFGDRILLASQSDSSIAVLRDGNQVPYIRTPGRPADIGVDTRRGRVAVPYIALNRVDLWALPTPTP